MHYSIFSLRSTSIFSILKVVITARAFYRAPTHWGKAIPTVVETIQLRNLLHHSTAVCLREKHNFKAQWCTHVSRVCTTLQTNKKIVNAHINITVRFSKRKCRYYATIYFLGTRVLTICVHHLRLFFFCSFKFKI